MIPQRTLPKPRTTAQKKAKISAVRRNSQQAGRIPLKDILSGCNKRAWDYSHASITDAQEWIDDHEQSYLNDKQRWIRRILALILLPIGMILLNTLISEINKASNELNLWISVPVWYTIMGFLIWSVFCISKICSTLFLYLYVLGHELTHLLAIKICFGKVSEFKAALEGGHVVTNKNNMFIALSPYFIPIWVLAWLFLGAITSLFFPWQAFSGVLFAGLGFWWGFHFYWTIWIIPKDQPDLKENGTFFSLMIIYLINLFMIILSLAVGNVIRPTSFVSELFNQAYISWINVTDLLNYFF